MSVVLIVGDSWGVPNYNGSFGVPKEHHTEFLLRNSGHTVYNCAINGGSNLESLNRAQCLLNSNNLVSYPGGDPISYDQPIEWLLWFHTEFFRENDLINYKHTLDRNMKDIAHAVYSKFSLFIKDNNLKLCVIGGQAQLEPELFSYMDPTFCIIDWRSDILKIVPPKSSHLLSRSFEWVPALIKDREEAIRVLNEQQQILELMQKSEHFPDNCHPGTTPHYELASILHEVFKSNKMKYSRAPTHRQK
jgi:hypothetical protein